MEQKLLGDNNDPKKWGTQLETHLMEMEVNKNRRTWATYSRNTNSRKGERKRRIKVKTR